MKKIISFVLLLCLFILPAVSLSRNTEITGTVVDKKIRPSYWQPASKNNKIYFLKMPQYLIVTIEYYKEGISEPFLTDHRVPYSTFAVLQIGDRVSFSENGSVLQKLE